MEIEELLRDIPIFDGNLVYYQPLNGGFSNQTYKLTCGDTPYVFRQFGGQNQFLHLSRASEIAAMRTMKDRAGCPEVLYFDPAEEYVLLEYIEGRQVTGEDLLDPDRCRQILSQLKAIHDTEVPESLAMRRCSPYQLVESYLRGAELLDVKPPEGLTPLLRRM